MPAGGMRTKLGGKCIAHRRTRPQPKIPLSHPHPAYNFFIATASAAPTGVGPAQVHPAADRRRWTRPERSVAHYPSRLRLSTSPPKVAVGG